MSSECLFSFLADPREWKVSAKFVSDVNYHSFACPARGIKSFDAGLCLCLYWSSNGVVCITIMATPEKKKIRRIKKTLSLSNMNKGGRAALARSRSIDHQIDEDNKRRQREVQLLILGGAGSGKSTFIKQLQFHYGDHFPEQSRLQYVQHILHNVTCALRVILLQMDAMGIQYDSEHNKRLARDFCEKHTPMSVEAVLSCLKEEDDRVEKAIQSRGDTKRRLTAQDVLKPQVPDLAVLQLLWTDCGVQCCYARRQKFEVIDVAGQKSLRKKWIHFFESVTAVLFFVSLSGYDDTLEEDPSTNMLLDSLQAFHEVSHNHFLEKTDFILFLNKKDLFLERIKTVSLTKCFPEYKGAWCAESSLRYIKEQFLQHKPGHKQLYIHLTCAVDITGMRDILANVMDIIMEINLRRTQLH
nr:hypothetical protein BaRGS_033937 [Batillaria attramentaria]